MHTKTVTQSTCVSVKMSLLSSTLNKGGIFYVIIINMDTSTCLLKLNSNEKGHILISFEK